MHPREKYQTDAEYRQLVDSLVDTIYRCQYTPSELREASILACIIYEENTKPNIKYDGSLKLHGMNLPHS